MNCSNKKLFRNFWVADGSGAPLKKRDVLLSGAVVEAVERDIPASAADEVFRGDGNTILAPGFIDAHGHSDLSLPAAPEAWSKVTQGITTEIGGNCGLSPFPLTNRNREHLQELYAAYGIPLNWSDLNSYRSFLESRKSSLKFVPLAGHNTLRAAAAGYEKEKLSGAELARMKEELDLALRQGAAGLSFGLLYVPGEFSSPGEIAELMRVVAAHGKICTAHLRSEGERLLESLEEMIQCARAAGLSRFHVSHLKTAGRSNWNKLPALLERIERARSEGLRLSFDRYPYTESATQLSVVLPERWKKLDDVTLREKLRNPEELREARRELGSFREEEYWRGVRLVSAPGSRFAGSSGKLFSELSEAPAEAVLEILAANAPGAVAAFSGMSLENMNRILDDPECVAGSDGNAVPEDMRFGAVHPRAFGAIVKFLRLRLDSGEEIGRAVRRLTGKTAELFGLADRGVIAPGKAADLTVFNPESVGSRADFTAPNLPADGIFMVVSDGAIIYRS